MAITKQKKVSIVDETTKKLDDIASLVFVGFKKLSVKDTIALRRSLRAEGVGYGVIKKTLLKRVLSAKGIDGTYPELSGEVAIAYGTDQLTPARLIHEFAKTHKEQVSIQGGIFEGKFMDATQMFAVATIPPREVLLAQIAYLLKSPIQRLAIGVNEVAKTKS